MLNESAFSYLEDTSDIAEYIHEDLYKSGMELSDVLHYLADEPYDYQRFRLDTYSENKMKEYKGIEKFFLNAYQAYGSLNHITLYSYERDEITEYTRDGKSYRRAGDEEFKRRLKEIDLADKDSFAYLKEIRDPTTMQVKGCMVLGFRNKQFESVRNYYSCAELIVYNDAGTAVYDSAGRHEIADIMDAKDHGKLEHVLNAYVEQAQSGQYHAISYLEMKQAAKVPISIVLMILSVGIVVMVLGEVFVRYSLQRFAKRLNRILEGMSKVMEGDLDVRIPAEKNGDELDY